ncbi:hypothetical protein GLOTRDRAFT_97242 [Gloeophyllum trabeum ATCC 11539]|uniref:Uncharacterized protein n=1 Tax=Gloeophyllum trabeum (strain ATCC 11539 / FP-39264 / Madison 617) TaxID=670483 RepID=S7PRS4_GLOTA|nr:uncharacterized protein GLOTRDRAFT_97242 [Gloeophyllum trabeum ATCC 11539]EPQ50077.1 hypothetical protein GLOTRDRAFT_97242 [Gloeophyllum trabeum ATCC 11539]
MALDFGNSGNPAELNGALWVTLNGTITQAGLCIALRGTQITYMSLRFPSPTYHTNDDLLHSVMTSIRYAVGMGLSSLSFCTTNASESNAIVGGLPMTPNTHDDVQPRPILSSPVIPPADLPLPTSTQRTHAIQKDAGNASMSLVPSLLQLVLVRREVVRGCSGQLRGKPVV